MKFNGWLTGKDLQDGSIGVCLFNTREEALESLDRTLEELDNGCFYDDGSLEEVNLEFKEVDGKLQLVEPYSTDLGE